MLLLLLLLPRMSRLSLLLLSLSLMPMREGVLGAASPWKSLLLDGGDRSCCPADAPFVLVSSRFCCCLCSSRCCIRPTFFAGREPSSLPLLLVPSAGLLRFTGEEFKASWLANVMRSAVESMADAVSAGAAAGPALAVTKLAGLAVPRPCSEAKHKRDETDDA